MQTAEPFKIFTLKHKGVLWTVGLCYCEPIIPMNHPSFKLIYIFVHQSKNDN